MKLSTVIGGLTLCAAVTVAAFTDSLGLTSIEASLERALVSEPPDPPSGFRVTITQTFYPRDAKTLIEKIFGSVTKIDYFFIEYTGKVTALGTEYQGLPVSYRR